MTHSNYQYANSLNAIEREKFYRDAFTEFLINGHPLSDFSVWLTEIHEGRFHTAINCLKTAKITAQKQVQFENTKHGGLYFSVLQAELTKKNKEIDDAITTLE